MTDWPHSVPARGRRRALLTVVFVGSMALAACSTDTDTGTGTDADSDTDADRAISSAATAPASSPGAASADSPATAPAGDSSTTAATTPATTASDPAATVPAATDQRQYDFAAVAPIVEATIDEHGLEGAALVVVQRDDGVVHEQYWGGFSADRVSLIASSSKMVVAGVLLRLADQGLIDLDAPVADAVDWGSGNPAITPAQLVSNSSGLVGLGPNPGYPPYICQFLPGGTLQGCASAIFTTTEDDGDIIAPDSEFRYGGAQWQVAGAVAEAVSGRSWAELIDETYVEPCGVESLGFNNHWAQMGVGFGYPAEFGADPSTLVATENPNLEGGAYVTAPDYASLLLMLLRGGRCDDGQVLSQAAIDRMLADRIGDVYGGSDDGKGYGMGWFVDRSNGRRTDPGAYGSVAWLDVEAGHGAFLVIEGAGRVGTDLAKELFGPVADAVASAS